ncbi:hypothetical protein D3C74_366910 [compost metagenome]
MKQLQHDIGIERHRQILQQQPCGQKQCRFHKQRIMKRFLQHRQKILLFRFLKRHVRIEEEDDDIGYGKDPDHNIQNQKPVPAGITVKH